MLTDDASHDAYNVQTSALESQKASEHQASQLMNHVLQKQAEEHSRSAAAMHAAARSQLTKQSFSVDDSHAHVEEISLSMTSFNRAFSSIDQYDFSSCWGNDAVGQGHCRPQIDSPQVLCFCFFGNVSKIILIIAGLVQQGWSGMDVDKSQTSKARRWYCHSGSQQQLQLQSGVIGVQFCLILAIQPTFATVRHSCQNLYQPQWY
jgi:hypothetical protein